MPQADKSLHILSETAAIISVPVLIYIGLQQENIIFMFILIFIAAAMLIVDGYLLYRYKDWRD